MTGSLPQLINGVILLSTFAGCRLMWGTYSSVCVFVDVFRAWRHGLITPTLAASDAGMMPELEKVLRSPAGLRSDIMLYAAGHDVPGWLALSYLASNITLNTLNWYWFGKMIATIRKRFDPPFGTKKPDDGANGSMDMDVQMGRTVYADGTKGVEVSEIRQRRVPALKDDIDEEELVLTAGAA